MEDAICLDCLGLNETFNHLEKNLESMINYVKDLERYASIFDEEMFNKLLDNNYRKTPKILCSKCKNEIGYEDYFLRRESLVPFLNEVCKIIGEGVSRYIQFCSNCELIKEFNAFNKIIEVEKGQVSKDNGQSVLEFLYGFDIPEDYNKYVLPNLQCRCCGIGQDESVTIKFNESFLIYNDDDLTDYLSVDIDELSQYAEKYFINLKKIELTNFSSFLRNYPMLGMRHTAAEKLYELFTKMYEEGEFSIIENLKLYRGRTRNKGTEKFHSKQMWNPPIGVSSHGRYNLVGSSVLYLTDNMDYIPAEVNYIGSQELDVATLIINKPLKILDLSQMY